MHGRGSEFQNVLRTPFVHVPLSHRRRNLYFLDLRDERSVRSALFLGITVSPARGYFHFLNCWNGRIPQFFRCPHHVVSHTSPQNLMSVRSLCCCSHLQIAAHASQSLECPLVFLYSGLYKLHIHCSSQPITASVTYTCYPVHVQIDDWLVSGHWRLSCSSSVSRSLIGSSLWSLIGLQLQRCFRDSFHWSKHRPVIGCRDFNLVQWRSMSVPCYSIIS